MKPKSHKPKPRRDDPSACVPLRRELRYILLLSLVYVSGLLLYAALFSPLARPPPPPGAVYRSHEVFRKLWPDIRSDNSSAIEISSVWTYTKIETEHKPCPTKAASKHFPMLQGSGPSGYLIIEANGGLNQQRSAICNAVAVAGLLNAILVIPWFEFNSVWRDPSEFSDIYDVDHFISVLGNHVKVVKELPVELMERYGNNITNITSVRVPAWSPVAYYQREVYPLLLKNGVVLLAPFANRLSMNAPHSIQLLRCFTNYRALRFSSPILILANKLVDRMIKKSSRNGGKYVSVHLRFEEDMVAFSGCVYDGGNDEESAMGSIRQTVWKKFKSKDRVIRPDLNRIKGNCPLTPLEVGMMLRGMGFDENTSIYLASGKIYQSQENLAMLSKMFPLLHSKESLATPEELAPFEGYSSRLAALDYTVCLHSEVFVTTQGGNFPQFLMGHRRFLYGGHAKTIMPDKRKLVLLMQDMTISWKDFKLHMQAMLSQSDRRGTKVPKVKKFNRHTPLYTYPLPECQCLQHSHNSTLKLTNLPQNLTS